MTIMIPVACDAHDVSVHQDEDFGFSYLYCADCDEVFNPVEWDELMAPTFG